MKSIVGPFVLAIVLAVAGAGFWVAGDTETSLADARKKLATLQYSEAAAASNEIDQKLGLERRVPMLGPQAEVDLRDLRAQATYWHAGYTSPAHPRGAARSL